MISHLQTAEKILPIFRILKQYCCRMQASCYLCISVRLRWGGLCFVCQDVCMWTCIPKELRDCSWECNEAGANERQSCERKVGGRAWKPWRQLKLLFPPSPFTSWPSLGCLSLLVWTEEADQVILKFRSAKETSESGLGFQCTECLWDKGTAGFCIALFCCKNQRQSWQGLKGWIDTNDAFSTWQLVG